jgi:hypothetical protein
MGRPIGDLAGDEPRTEMPHDDDLAQILTLENRQHVIDMGRQADPRDIGAVGQTGQCHRADGMTPRPQPARHRLPDPGPQPGAGITTNVILLAHTTRSRPSRMLAQPFSKPSRSSAVGKPFWTSRIRVFPPLELDGHRYVRVEPRAVRHLHRRPEDQTPRPLDLLEHVRLVRRLASRAPNVMVQRPPDAQVAVRLDDPVGRFRVQLLVRVRVDERVKGDLGRRIEQALQRQVVTYVPSPLWRSR